ncbi:HAD family hydrolase [Nonomuraea mesophila]|uniref:HAD family hydrolase n=1 Tax=Nonomuraea mesophila TaxID=2530382 RepID=A0A4R5E6I9_9ACTN|nr:HAD-IIIA family hydrolase [Nonomuraea mesophila]TDE26425.1 HAD family hydrolase [Nonomuraea mesophila]
MALSGVDTVRAVLSKTQCLLLDFDGPICDIFAGLSAATVAANLRATLEAAGASLSPQVRSTDDPLEVFRFSASLSDDLTHLTLRTLTELEVKAAATARSTPGVADLMECARDKGMTIGIVTNNSGAAVATFLDRKRLADRVDYVSARSAADPSLMKPNPHLLNQALIRLNADPSVTLLVGDSTTDIEASKLAGVFAIGYANRPGKAERLTEAGADLIVTSMEELIASLA